MLLLAILTATLVGVTFHAWRLGNEKRDVALLGVFSGQIAAWLPAPGHPLSLGSGGLRAI